MKSKVKIKRIKNIMLFCILLIILLFIIIKCVEINNDKPKTNEELIAEQIQSYLSDKICPRNLSVLYGKYKGENSKNDLYRNFKVFVNDLPNFISNIKDKQENDLIVYFEKNKDYMYEYLGIESKEEFLELSKYFQTKPIDGTLFEYCEIEETSFKTEEDGKYLSFNVKFYFKNNIDSLNLKISFANYTKNKPQVKYNVAY